MTTTKRVSSLISNIEENQYFLPEFQRGYVWTSDQVKAYFQSMYLGYPTGTFLVWKAKNPPKVRGGSQSSDHDFKELILDGQQRLTTLYVIFRGKEPPWFEGKTLRTDLYFNLETEDFQYYTKTLMQGKREWINISALLQKGVGEFVEQNDEESKKYLLSRFSMLNRLANIYQYTYYIQEIEEQDTSKVVDIFNLVNKAGTPLSQTDLALALMTNRWEECKNQMRKASEKYAKIGFYFTIPSPK